MNTPAKTTSSPVQALATPDAAPQAQTVFVTPEDQVVPMQRAQVGDLPPPNTLHERVNRKRNLMQALGFEPIGTNEDK